MGNVVEANAVLERLAAAGLRAPRSLTVAVTRACNLTCAHCWVESPAEASPVSPESLRGVVSAFCALGGRELCLTGGEPLAHPRWAEILDRACAEPRLSTVRLQTNGTLLTREAVDRLRGVSGPRLRVQVSLEGATGATHDRVRGAGAFVRVRQGLELLAGAGLAGCTTVAFTEMRHNLEELDQVLALVEDLGLGGVTSAPVVRCGRARASEGLEPPTPDQYRSLLDRYGSDTPFRARADRLGRITALAWLRGLDRSRSEGCTFVENPYLTADGTLFPCVLLHGERYAGREVFTRGLLRALLEAIPRWIEASRVSRRRLAETPECRDCSCQTWCGAGCMGRAWGTHGELLRAEDRCALRRAVSSWPG